MPRDIVKKSIAVKKLNDALANCEQTFTYSVDLTELDFFSHLTNLLLDFETPEALLEMVEADEAVKSRAFSNILRLMGHFRDEWRIQRCNKILNLLLTGNTWDIDNSSECGIVCTLSTTDKITERIEYYYKKCIPKDNTLLLTLQIYNLNTNKQHNYHNFDGKVPEEAFKGGKYFLWRLVFPAPSKHLNRYAIKVFKFENKFIQGFISIQPDGADSLKLNDQEIALSDKQDFDSVRQQIDYFIGNEVNSIIVYLPLGGSEWNSNVEKLDKVIEYCHSKNTKVILSFNANSVNP